MQHSWRTAAITTIAVLATLATGTLATAPASAVTSAAHGGVRTTRTPLPRFAPQRAAVFAARASKLPDSLAAAIRTQLGISPSDFLAEGAAGAQASALVAAARARGVQVRDARLDGTRLVVTVASEADAAALAGTGADVTVGPAPAAPTLPEPVHADAADPSLATGLHGGQGWWSIEADDPAYIAICSVGFNGTEASGASAASAFVTAGHCEQSEPLLPQVNSTGSTHVDARGAVHSLVGRPGSATFEYGSGFDSGLVDVAPAVAAPADVTTWGGGTGASTTGANVRLAGASDVIKGQTVCRSGYRSGWQCGYVLVTDHVLAQISGHAVNTIVTSACSQEGDSGGSVLSGEFAVGIVSGGSWPTDASGAQPDPVCTKLAAANAKAARSYLSSGAQQLPDGLQVTLAFPMVSQSGDPSIESQQPDWQLGVWFDRPAVTSATTSRIAGTVALNTTPGAANPDAVQVSLDGGAPLTAPIAADGGWSLPLPLANTPGHSYAVTAVSDATGVNRSRSATATGAVLAVQHPSSAVSASFSGTARVRGVLTASSKGWPAGAALSYRWYANGAAIAGATKRSFTLTGAQYRARIRVKVTASRSGWVPLAATSAQSAAIAIGTMRPATPTITGRAVVGATLREHPGSWSPISVTRSVRWFANGRPIAGATHSTLHLTAALRGKRITVKVTATHAGFRTTSATSRRRVVVAARR